MTHTQPILCAHCWEEMNSSDAFWKHFLQGTICQKQPENIRLIDLINSDFVFPWYSRLLLEEEKWAILESLFPDDGKVPSSHNQRPQALTPRFDTPPNLFPNTLPPGMTQWTPAVYSEAGTIRDYSSSAMTAASMPELELQPPIPNGLK